MKIMLLVVPLIGAVYGWLVTTFLFKMLFWPQEPFLLPFGIVIRGLLPQKREELAAGVREIIETQFLLAVAGENGSGSDVLERLIDTAALAAREHVYQRTPVLIPKPVKIKVADLVEEFIRREMPQYVSGLTEGTKSQDITAALSGWAQDKIDSFDLTELELSLKRSRQVFYLKAGASAIGLIFGLIQLLIIWVSRAWQT